MALLDRALWHIESQLENPLDLTGLAEACATSPFHLSRTFRGGLGMSPMAYLRARRLTEAARHLAKGDDTILAVALGAQFQSHEAFTRAFASCFGVLPSTVRKARSTKDLTLQEPIRMDISRIVDIAPPDMRDRGEFQVIGMSEEFSFENTAGVPKLWAKFAAREYELEQDPPIGYGVCYDADAEGRFTYMSALEVDAGTAVPEGMARKTIPAGLYAVFTHDGHISDIGKTVYTIWNKALPDLGIEPREAPDFERYDHRFDPRTGRGVVEIWIPVTG